MKYFIFTIYDNKAEAYLPPFFLPSENQALRTFGDCCCDDTHQFGKHPSDYTLFNVGSFDDDSALITPYAAKKALAQGNELVSLSEKLTEQDENLIGKLTKKQAI